MKKKNSYAACLLVSSLGLILPSGMSNGNEIGFVEDFALSEDREEILRQLVPGSEDYYYYHCLHYQNEGKLDKVDELLTQWIKRGKNARNKEIANRQALLRYESDPGKSLDYIKKELGVRFEHRKETLGGEKTDLPTRLNPNLISRETLKKKAFKNSENLSGFEDSALDWLIGEGLDETRLRHLLSRLQRPDYEQLPKLALRDLAAKHSGGFGSHSIHSQLLLSQMDYLIRKSPGLLSNQNFVNAYLTKLQPEPGVDLRFDREERNAHLRRLWSFASTLPPAFNSLKACVLYHRLTLEREEGRYDRALFMEYLKLPRQVFYINPDYLRSQERDKNYAASLSQNFEPWTLLVIVGTDEPLVRDYLMRFFVEESGKGRGFFGRSKGWGDFETYIKEEYLKEVYAEAMLVNGLGDAEEWYSMLGASRLQQLKERVDLDFSPTNKDCYNREDAVSLEVFVKNVKNLIVRVYEINTGNYYRQNKGEMTTALNLDGLVANEEQVHEYEEPSLRRVKRTFDFPSMEGPGAYIVEFIGNGKTSRALIRKGKLSHIVRTSVAGHVFTILDEKNRRIEGASIWLDSHYYKADEEGAITVPFTNQPAANQPIVISDGAFSSLAQFEHQGEKYDFQAGFHVEREALLAGEKAALIVRPALRLNGKPVTLSVLEDISLTIASADGEGVQSSYKASDFEIFEDRESIHELQVPSDLRQLVFTLSANVKSLSKNEKQNLSVSGSVSLNQIDATNRIEALIFGGDQNNHTLDLLGKTGESRPNRTVQVEIKHRDFHERVHVALQTNERGRIMLGELKDIEWINATGPEGTQERFHLDRDRRSLPQSVHARAGEKIRIPYMGPEEKPRRNQVSFHRKARRGFRSGSVRRASFARRFSGYFRPARWRILALLQGERRGSPHPHRRGRKARGLDLGRAPTSGNSQREASADRASEGRKRKFGRSPCQQHGIRPGACGGDAVSSSKADVRRS